MITEQDTRTAIFAALEPYRNKQHGRNRYNTPWRPDADGGTLAIDERHDYALGIAWHDHKDGTGGNGITLAQRLNVALPDREPQGVVLQPVKRAKGYESLADYAAAHGVGVGVFEAAGWHETRRGGRLNLLAFAIPTDGGTRYRYADEAKAGRKYDHDKGTKYVWYGLTRAARLAGDGPLVICNGEASTIVAQHYGVAACCVTGGERGSIPEPLVEELRAAWGGPILVAFDGDDQGRKAGPSLAAHLRAFHLDAEARDLGGANGFDLADFCQIHQTNAPAALLTTRPLIVASPKAQALELIRDWKAEG
jgi:hypothetical protein